MRGKTKRLVALCLGAVLLSGCLAEPEEAEAEPVLPPLSTQMDSCSLGSWGIASFSTFNGYVSDDVSIQLFPYFDTQPHITMKRLNLSGQPLLERLDTCLPGSVVIDHGDGIYTVSDGFTTYGYRSFGESVVLAETSDIDADYVVLALRYVWLDS